MNIVIHYNFDKDKDFEKTSFVAKRLEEVGFEVFFDCEKSGYKMASEEDYYNMDCLVVLGGDGTVLKMAGISAKYDLPILGINIGNLGFLTTFEYSEVEKAIEALIGWNFVVEERKMIQTVLGNKKYLALNDIVVSRGIENSPYGRIVSLSVYSGDYKLDDLVADGVILSTPTGSTAYSLSSGGPILEPTLSGIVMTPICSHALHNRPMVLKDQDIIRVVVDKAIVPCNLFVDGQLVGKVYEGVELEITKAKEVVKLLKPKGENFYNRLYRKLIRG